MGWTQRQLAEKWNYSFDTISAWERGVRNPNGQEIPHLASLLGMQPEELANGLAGNRSGTRRVQTQESNGHEVQNLAQAKGELEHVYLSRTEFTRHFSYPRMFEGASTLLCVGIGLNAIAMSYSSENIINSILQSKCKYTLCFLAPDGKRSAEREDEETGTGRIISSLTSINIAVMKDTRERIKQIDIDASRHLEIMQYDLIPRYNIYMVDDSLMTVQAYAYNRGEDTPIFVLRRCEPHGLFEFYASAARYIREHAQPID